MKYGGLLKNASTLDNLYYIDYEMLKKKIRSSSFISILEDEIKKFDDFYKKRKIGLEDIQSNYYYIIMNYLSIVKIVHFLEEKSSPIYKAFLDKYRTLYDFMDNYHFFVDLNNASGLRNRILRGKASSIDIVSDIHVDQWSTKYTSKYPCGDIVNKPYSFNNPLSNILIVAGDISDDIDLSIEILNDVSKFYKRILFVDGNHEHVHNYPKLYPVEVINNKFKRNNNKKIVYLPKNEFIINKTAFIGVCGWWNYNNMTTIENSQDYFKKWIPHFKEKDNREFVHSVIKQSIEEYEHLKILLEMYENDESIENVIIITHTIPLLKYCEKNGDDNSSTQLNTKMIDLINHGYKKLSHWIFGHTHDHHEFKYNNIHFICNPRGRPEDFNRIKYQKKTVEFVSKL